MDSDPGSSSNIMMYSVEILLFAGLFELPSPLSARA